MSQIFRRVRQLNDQTGDGVAFVERYQTNGRCLVEHCFEHGRVLGEKTSVDAEFDIFRDQDDGPVAKPELRIASRYRTCAIILRFRSSTLLSVNRTANGGGRSCLRFLLDNIFF